MTKDDLRMLAQLPKMITVLRKLAAQSDELRGLLGALNMTPAASQASPARAGARPTAREVAPPQPAPSEPEPDAPPPPPIWVCGVCGDHLPSQPILDAHVVDVHQGTNEAKNAERRLDRHAEVVNNGAIKAALLTQFAKEG